MMLFAADASRLMASYGVMRNGVLLVRVPPGVITVILPVVAPAGTVVLIWEFDTTVKVAAVPLKLTEVVPLRFVPKIMMTAPTLPAPGSVLTNGPSPTAKLKTEPWWVPGPRRSVP